MAWLSKQQLETLREVNEYLDIGDTIYEYPDLYRTMKSLKNLILLLLSAIEAINDATVTDDYVEFYLKDGELL